jgi:hypothetical protein
MILIIKLSKKKNFKYFGKLIQEKDHWDFSLKASKICSQKWLLLILLRGQLLNKLQITLGLKNLYVLTIKLHNNLLNDKKN